MKNEDERSKHETGRGKEKRERREGENSQMEELLCAIMGLNCSGS